MKTEKGVQGMEKTTKKKYDKAFREAAVRSWRSSKDSVAEHASSLGIPAQTLNNWIHRSPSKQETSGSSSQEVVELQRLVREQAEEIAILKKAAAYFARGVK
jgi:transposase